MKRTSLIALAAALFLAGCGIDGAPLTPSAKTAQIATSSTNLPT